MINHVRYTWGFCENIEELADSPDLKQAEWSNSAIPESITTSAHKESVLDFEGICGDPEWGTPIEVDIIEFEAEGESQEITIYNRGIFLMCSDSEEIKRLHRFCCVMRNCAER